MNKVKNQLTSLHFAVTKKIDYMDYIEKIFNVPHIIISEIFEAKYLRSL